MGDPDRLWTPAAFAGWDKYSPPRYPGRDSAKWERSLLRSSNLSFVWHYLSHWPTGPRDTRNKVKEEWKAMLPDLLAQGWGIVFTCVPVSQRRQDLKDGSPDDTSWVTWERKKQQGTIALWPRQPKPGSFTIDESRQLGAWHANILKKDFAAPLGRNAVQGAMVVVDNEDQPSPPLGEVVLAYYTELFRELRRPGETGLVLRPGYYSRPGRVEQMLAYDRDNCDLHLWMVDPEAGYPDKDSRDAWDQRPVRGASGLTSRIYSFAERYPIKNVRYEDEDKIRRTGLLLGRQCILYAGIFPANPSDRDMTSDPLQKDPRRKNLLPATVSSGRMPEGLFKVSGIDFNSSLVRDARYPLATPRHAITNDVRIVSGYTVDATLGLLTTLTQIDPKPAASLPCTASDSLVEHEGPILLLPPASKESFAKTQAQDGMSKLPSELQSELITLSKDSAQPVVFGASPDSNFAKPWSWSKPQPVFPDQNIQLRRNRAMAAVKVSHRYQIRSYLFFIQQDHVVMASRRLGSGPWTPPSSIAMSTKAHPFSNITAVSRGKDSLDVFFVNNDGQLSTSWCPGTSTEDWPGNKYRTIPGQNQNKPRLDVKGKSSANEQAILLQTSIAAVSPSESTILVFAIGRDCKLRMASFESSQDWTDLTTLSSNDSPEPRLFPHAQLDAIAVSPNLVSIASITETNVPCLFTLSRDKSTWRMQAPVLTFPNPAYAPSDSQRKNDPNLAPGLSKYDEAPRGPREPYGRTWKASGYAFNPYGDVKLSLEKGTLMIQVVGVIGDATPGEFGDRGAVLCRKAVDDKTELWKRIG